MQILTPHLHYKNQQLWMENVSIQHLVQQIAQQTAQNIETPFYCYSHAALQDNITACKAAFSPHNINIHYAMKANSNLSILRIIAEQGLGVDIVSIGEMQRALRAGFSPQDIVFSGVGKTAKELEAAILAGVGQFNLESKEELQLLEQVAKQVTEQVPSCCASGVSALIRVNPEVTVDTHKNITTGAKGNKFGVCFYDVLPMLDSAQQAGIVRIKGIAMHIGSQINSTQPYLDAIDKIVTLISELADKGHTLEQLDLGGGFGVNYAVNYVTNDAVNNEASQPPSFADFAVAINQALPNWPGDISVEPGRSLVANIGVMVSKVTYIKQSEPMPFLILDAAMNDLMRPALYQATHRLIPVTERPTQLQQHSQRLYDVVGPICESTDTFEKAALLPHDLAQGELMCFLYTGAYCAVMSNSYNSRPIIAEVLIEHDSASVIRQPISQAALMAFEEPVEIAAG